MSESYVEVREDGSVRLAGTLAYPEATVADVLTVQADGSIAAATGGGSIPSLPIATPAGTTIDSTTYDNTWSGSGKLTTVVLPDANHVVLAFAISGDPFPRVVVTAGGVIFFGDGTFDAVNQPGGVISGVLNAPGLYELALNGTQGNLAIATSDPEYLVVTQVQNSLQVNDAGTITTGTGDPNGAVGGRVGDVYIREDGGDGSWIYRCTFSGVAAAATWVAKV